MSEFVCCDTIEYIKWRASKCQMLAIREGGTECVEGVAMEWKDKGAILKDMKGPATHPLNGHSPECEMTECMDKW